MLILLLTYVYFARSDADALLLTTSLDLSKRESFFGSNEVRSVWDIVKSCLLTIFACTWVSVHMNMPNPEGRWYTTLSERIRITVVALLVPE